MVRNNPEVTDYVPCSKSVTVALLLLAGKRVHCTALIFRTRLRSHPVWLDEMGRLRATLPSSCLPNKVATKLEIYVICVSNVIKCGTWFVCWLVGCLTSQQHESVSQGRICSDKFTCCHTETEVADHTFHFTQSQYTDTGPTSPSTDPKTPGAWQGSH